MICIGGTLNSKLVSQVMLFISKGKECNFNLILIQRQFWTETYVSTVRNESSSFVWKEASLLLVKWMHNYVPHVLNKYCKPVWGPVCLLTEIYLMTWISQCNYQTSVSSFFGFNSAKQLIHNDDVSDQLTLVTLTPQPSPPMLTWNKRTNLISILVPQF